VGKTDLKVTIDANAAKLEREIQRASRSMLLFEGSIRRAGSSAEQLDRMLGAQRAAALNTLGRGMLAFGAATLVGLGLAVKAAIDWESAWAGVLKTVEGTPEQLARVETGLRDLASELPASHREIAAVAEAAGQLGVATDDVVGFTRVMIDLGETTNLTADEAATSIARLMNVMQTAPADVGRLGAALVELGNNGASTEREILEMAQRISGAGQIIGLAEHEVLAIANALSSVGIEAEAGGTAISTAMIKMADAVATGGEAVQGFAEVAGMSSDAFVTAFETNPAQAIQAFVSGLDRIDAAGGNVFAVLDSLGLGTIRTRDALLRLAGAGDLLSQSLDDGARSWEENTALIEEAAKRYDTTEAKIQIAKNALVELAIDVGSVVLPAIAMLAEGAADIAKFFSDLPGPVKAAVTVLGLLAGVTTAAGGGFLLLAPRIAAVRAQMLILARTAPVLYGALATVGPIGLALAALGALVLGIVAVNNALKDTGPSASEATQALLDMSKGAADTAFHRLVTEMEAVAERAGAMQDVLRQGRGAFGDMVEDADVAESAFEQLRTQLTGFDEALVSLVQGGNADLARSMFEDMAEVLSDRLGVSVEDVTAALPAYADALSQVENEQRIAAESATPLEDSLVAIGEQFGLTGDDVAAAAQDMLDAWSGAVSEFFNLNDALVNDQETTVDEFIAELERQVQAQRDWEANLLALSSRVPAAFLDQLARMGPEGATQVALFAQMTDAELQNAVGLWSESTGEGAAAIAQRLAEAGPVLAEISRRHGSAVAQSIAAGMAANGTTVFAEATRQGVLIDRGVGTDRTRTAHINVGLIGVSPAEAALNRLARDRAMAIRVTVSTGVRVPGVTGQGGIPMQHGTHFAPGGMALVGEEGPELVEVPRGSRVHTASETRAILANPAAFVGSGSGGGGVVVNAHLEISERDANSPLMLAALREVSRHEALDLLREMQAQQRRGGRA
jgi:TP901 family phage tail tape measure protein